jgi:hypothetical protein
MLNATGGLTTDALPAGGQIHGLRFQTDGKLLMTGTFSTIGGQQRNALARLSTPIAARYGFESDGAQTHWRRAGAAPELESPPSLWRSFDGFDFVRVETMTRIAGGWRSTSLQQTLVDEWQWLRVDETHHNQDGTGIAESGVLRLRRDRLFRGDFE